MKTSDRVAFSPAEFAALFGKSQTWGYRQIYAGKVKTMTEHGRILIPAAEVESILATAGVYNGIKAATSPKTKSEIQRLQPKLTDTWQQYLARRKDSEKGGKKSPATPRRKLKKASSRSAALQALAARSKAKRS